jgi:hypothetical protein
MEMFWSHGYRNHLRYVCRALAGPEHDAVRMGEPVNTMPMPDLEALAGLILKCDPRVLAPPDYQPRH